MGATVSRGIMGYGAKNVIYTASILDLSEDLPLLIEAIDTEEKIALVLPLVTNIVKKGLVATADVEIIV